MKLFQWERHNTQGRTSEHIYQKILLLDGTRFVAVNEEDEVCVRLKPFTSLKLL